MTAVEELKIKLIFNSIVKEKLNGKVSFTIGLSKLDEIFKQAKEMEEAQRQKDFIAGNNSACMEHENIEDYFKQYIKSE